MTTQIEDILNRDRARNERTYRISQRKECDSSVRLQGDADDRVSVERIVAEILDGELVLHALGGDLLAEQHRDDATRSPEPGRLAGVNADLIRLNLLDDSDDGRGLVVNCDDNRAHRDRTGDAGLDRQSIRIGWSEWQHRESARIDIIENVLLQMTQRVGDDDAERERQRRHSGNRVEPDLEIPEIRRCDHGQLRSRKARGPKLQVVAERNLLDDLACEHASKPAPCSIDKAQRHAQWTRRRKQDRDVSRAVRDLLRQVVMKRGWPGTREIGLHQRRNGLRKDVATRRTSPQIVEAEEVRPGEFEVVRVREAVLEPRVVAAGEVHPQLRRAVAERLVQGHTQAGRGNLDRMIPDQLLGEPLHVFREGGRGSRGDGICLSQETNRCGSEVDRQRARFLGQHQRIRRQRNAKLAHRGFECEPACDLVVGIKRRGKHFPADLRDEIEADRLRIAGSNRLDLPGRIADDGRAAHDSRIEIQADEVRGRRAGVGDRHVERVRPRQRSRPRDA